MMSGIQNLSEYEVVCIKRSNGYLKSNNAITHIGYKNLSMMPVIITIQAAIQMIQGNVCRFYVKEKFSGQRAYVIPVATGLGLLASHLRTTPNGIGGDNLESLPECAP